MEVETDKATVVYEAEAEERWTRFSRRKAQRLRSATRSRRSRTGPGRRPQKPAGRRPNATPVARRIAVDLGVSLHDVDGTGPGGRITQEDVQRAATADGAPRPVGGKGDVRALELTATQATIARRMVESASTIPAFTVSADVDVSLIAALRKDVDGAPSLDDFIVKASALTLQDFPRFNASYANGKVECYSRINVGIAVATDDALLVPAVVDANRKRMAEIAADTRRLADAARRPALRPRTSATGRSRSRTSACTAFGRSRRSSIRRRWPSSRSAAHATAS